MSKIDKLKQKLKRKPTAKDFTWQELERLLTSEGYEKRERSGSRVCFLIPGKVESIIQLHKPHPGNELKPKALDAIRQTLEEQGII